MRRTATVAVLLVVLTLTRGAGAPSADNIWFCPGPGTIDYIRLFEHPEEWPNTRAR